MKSKLNIAAAKVDLPQLVRRLGDADRITNEWRKKHDAILREVGTAMREERERCNVSLRSLAKQLGCSAPFLSDMERGYRKYSIEWCREAMAILSPNNLDEGLRSPESATKTDHL